MWGGEKASLVAQMVKNVMWETWVTSLGWEDSLEERMATHSSTLAWRIPIDRGAWWLQSLRFQRAGHDWVTKHITHGHCNVCHVFPRLLVVCESLCCDFLRMKSWKEHSTLWKCYNGKLFQASRSQNLRGFSVFFFFLPMVLILGQIDPIWEADTRLDASPGDFHHIHMMPLKLLYTHLPSLTQLYMTLWDPHGL